MYFGTASSLFIQCLISLQMSLAPRSAQGGAFLSFQGSIGAGGVLPKGSNDARGDVVGGRFAGDSVEKDSPPDSGVGKRGPSSLERISIAPTPLPRASQPEGGYTNAGRYCKYLVCVCVCVCVCACVCVFSVICLVCVVYM